MTAFKSMLLRLCNDVPQFQTIVEIGRKRNLEIADPVIGSQNPKDCLLAFALNYYPIRHDTSQPCIDKINSFMIMILVELYEYTLVAATEFSKNKVVYLNQSPFKLAYKDVEADKAGYNKLLSETDGPMMEVITQVIKRFSNLASS